MTDHIVAANMRPGDAVIFEMPSERIAGVARLWVVEQHHHTRLPVLQGLGLRPARVWHPADIWLFRYVRG